jgi:hypothetical protein
MSKFPDSSVMDKSTIHFHNTGHAADKHSCSPSVLHDEYV